jgi:hypothetical protein
MLVDFEVLNNVRIDFKPLAPLLHPLSGIKGSLCRANPPLFDLAGKMHMVVDVDY